GAPVQSAKLTLANVQTGVKQTAASSSVGDYVFVNVQPGTYKLTAELSGFKTQEASDLHLGVDQTLRQSFTLSVGAVTEQVSVRANAQLVQTDNTTIG